MAHLIISYRNGSILFLVNWQTFSDSILCGPWLGMRTLCRNNFGIIGGKKNSGIIG